MKKCLNISIVYAIAAMAIGTTTIPKVEKICGPGNAYVAAAKRRLYGEVALDLVAGPSEGTALGNVLLQLRAGGEVGTMAEMRAISSRSVATKLYEPTLTK